MSSSSWFAELFAFFIFFLAELLLVGLFSALTLSSSCKPASNVVSTFSSLTLLVSFFVTSGFFLSLLVDFVFVPTSFLPDSPTFGAVSFAGGSLGTLAEFSITFSSWGPESTWGLPSGPTGGVSWSPAINCVSFCFCEVFGGSFLSDCVSFCESAFCAAVAVCFPSSLCFAVDSEERGNFTWVEDIVIATSLFFGFVKPVDLTWSSFNFCSLDCSCFCWGVWFCFCCSASICICFCKAANCWSCSWLPVFSISDCSVFCCSFGCWFAFCFCNLSVLLTAAFWLSCFSSLSSPALCFSPFSGSFSDLSSVGLFFLFSLAAVLFPWFSVSFFSPLEGDCCKVWPINSFCGDSIFSLPCCCNDISCWFDIGCSNLSWPGAVGIFVGFCWLVLCGSWVGFWSSALCWLCCTFFSSCLCWSCKMFWSNSFCRLCVTWFCVISIAMGSCLSNDFPSCCSFSNKDFCWLISASRIRSCSWLTASICSSVKGGGGLSSGSWPSIGIGNKLEGCKCPILEGIKNLTTLFSSLKYLVLFSPSSWRFFRFNILSTMTSLS